MYQLPKLQPWQTKQDSVIRLSDNAFIPFNPANSDYQTFRKDVAGGVELQDADGNVMTQAQVDDFLKTIPE